MPINIFHRRQRVAESLGEKAQQTVAQLAQTLGISKSSAQRHRHTIHSRQADPVSAFWSSAAGLEYLARVMVLVVYCFGIQGGVGGDETFFNHPLLVLMELSSGYLFFEVEKRRRTFESWQEEVGARGVGFSFSRSQCLVGNALLSQSLRVGCPARVWAPGKGQECRGSAQYDFFRRIA